LIGIDLIAARFNEIFFSRSGCVYDALGRRAVKKGN